ncbi:Uncharacterised protein [Mycobacterium tuberculosis]|nr:Uncharacterised protein [Mycobacterium tuberculosis]COX33173.1 Uncharacterised protein [Mycobacterium tuberculosis]
MTKTTSAKIAIPHSAFAVPHVIPTLAPIAKSAR